MRIAHGAVVTARRRLKPALAIGVLVAVAAAHGAAAGTPAPVLAQDVDPGAAAAVRVVERYAAALSRGDATAAVALFSEAAGYAGGWGAENLAGQLRRDVAANRWLEIVWSRAERDQAKPDAYAVTFGWRSNQDPFGRLGVPPLEGVDVATVQSGKIVLVTGRVDEDSLARRQPAIEAALRTSQAQARARATETARATAVAQSGVLDRIPDTQARGETSPSLAIPAAAVGLLAAALLAARTKFPRS